MKDKELREDLRFLDKRIREIAKRVDRIEGVGSEKKFAEFCEFAESNGWFEVRRLDDGDYKFREYQTKEGKRVKGRWDCDGHFTTW